MLSLRAQLFRFFLLMRSRRASFDVPIEGQRARMEKLLGVFEVSQDTTVEAVEIEQVSCEWVTAAEANPQHLLIYFHGGGYALGSCRTHRGLAAALSAASGCAVLTVGYRLAPEHPYPAALEDSLTVYRALLREGYTAPQIALGGDSAGGGLTIATLLKLRDAKESLPSAAVLISPWVDLTMTADSLTRLADKDPILSPATLERLATHYIGADDPQNPYISPVYGDLMGLPPILIHVGGDEILLDDSTTLAQKLEATGATATLEVWPSMWHVWHHLTQPLPEARRAVADIGRFLRQYAPRSI